MILWGLVALRLVLPLSVSSTLSLLRLGNAADLPAQLEDALNSDDTYRGNYKTAIEGSREYELAVLAGSPVAASTEGGKMAYYYERANGSIAPAKTSYEMFLIIGSHVWLAGMAALWLWAICSYLRLKYRLRFSIRLCKGVYETDAVPSPCVTGILRPQIYLIPALTDQQKEHILLHEKMHIRHLDPVWKMVSFVVISIHWFNPFLWFMYKIFQGELEKACDERVLAHLGEDKKADYSESLLALSASKNWRQSSKRSHRPTGSQCAGRSVKADCWKKFHRTYTISGTGIGCNYMRNCPFTLLSEPTTHIPYNRKISASYRPLPTGTGCFWRQRTGSKAGYILTISRSSNCKRM